MRDVEAAARNGRALVVAPGTVVTPAARERAAELRVAIRVQRDRLPPVAVPLPALREDYDLIEPLAAFVIAAAAQPLPEEIIDRTKLLLIDSLAAGYSGIRNGQIRALAESLAARRHGERGHLIGLRQKLVPTDAALVNASMIHAHGLDARFDPGDVSPLPGPVAATLALADELRLREPGAILPAIAIGVEVGCRIAAAATNRPSLSRTAAIAALGGTAAAAVLLDLELEALIAAFGLALSQALLPVDEESSLGPLVAGFGAQAAVQAARLAAGGVVGPRQVIEGPAGYARLVERGQFNRTAALDGLGATWRLEDVRVQLYPVDRHAAAAVESAVQLAGGRLAPERIQQLVIEASAAVVRAGAGKPGPAAPPAELRRSLPYLVARALRDGWIGLDSVEPSSAPDPDLWELMERIELSPSPEIPPDSETPVRLLVLTTEGILLESTVDGMPGDLSNETTRERVLSKLADCWRVSGQPRYRRPLRLVDAVESLDLSQSLTAFWSAVSPQAAL
ncbi:MAG: MmgE/PrpD family protein [Dehalococcoidia bacterium]|nr:MAG: MmgE/PrpD family protein [Dehalococcoidia bacterium]